jgi:hypothetical protein
MSCGLHMTSDVFLKTSFEIPCGAHIESPIFLTQQNIYIVHMGFAPHSRGALRMQGEPSRRYEPT